MQKIVQPRIALILAVPFSCLIYTLFKEGLGAHYYRCRKLDGWKKMFEEWALKIYGIQDTPDMGEGRKQRHSLDRVLRQPLISTCCRKVPYLGAVTQCLNL
jgi:hypothetical protein